MALVCCCSHYNTLHYASWVHEKAEEMQNVVVKVLYYVECISSADLHVSQTRENVKRSTVDMAQGVPVFLIMLREGSLHTECCVVLHCVALCCIVLHCVALCCIVLHCVAVCCSVLQCVALCCLGLPWVALFCSVLRYVAVCFGVLQCVAACYNVLCLILIRGFFTKLWVSKL